MSRLSNSVRWAEAYPHLVVQLVLALSLIATGIYLVGPWYIAGSATVFAYLDADYIRTVTGSIYFMSGATNLYGLAKDSVEVRYWGTLFVFLSFIAMTLLRLLTFGFSPIVWVFTLTLGIIAAVKHLGESHRRKALRGELE